MASNAAIQQYINDSADPALSVYSSSTQQIPVTSGNTAVFITNVNEYTTINVSDPSQAAGNTTELQFNLNGRMDGDEGLTYNPTTDSLDVLGNLTAGTVYTNNLKYANGTNWSLGGSSYGNANVATYLPTYVGNLNPNVVSATLFAGSGANLTNIPAGNLVGSVPVAAVANSVDGANVTGTVANATHAITAGTANTVAGANVTGTVPLATSAGSATTAGTVTTAAQPNITSVGTLTGLTVSNSTGVVNFLNTANVSLGSIANLKIGGGSNGQVLTATGTGNTVQWSTPTAGNLQDITTNGATTDQAVSITNTTSSTNAVTGALKVTGGVGISGNVHVQNSITSYSTIYAGSLSDFGSWQVPVFLGRDAGAEYIQGALVNTNENGSADWVAYNDLSDGDGGMSAWADMGFTGSNFSDPLYTITNANDGYFFVQGKDTLSGGNLVIATGEKGTHHDIVFATGGFLEANEAMRLDNERNVFFVGGHAHAGLSDKIIDLDVNGNTELRGNLKVTKRSDLGSAANVYITGGTSGQVLSTDGAGNLSWTTVSGGASTGDFTFTNNSVTVTAGQDMVLTLEDENEDGYVVEQNVTVNSTVNTRTRLDANEFTIETDIPGVGHTFSFEGSGNLQIPGSVYGFNNNVALAAMDAGGHPKASLQSISNTNDPNVFTSIDATYTGANIVVYQGGSNSAFDVYTWKFDNAGNLTVPGHILPSANLSYDLGSDTARFRDLYLSGTTINLGGTLIQAQANGEVSIGNATFSSSGTISAADVTLGITTLSSNTIASSSHIGTMVVFSPGFADVIRYSLPNVATAGFTVGSRIELFADSQSTIMVEPDAASGVTIYASKGLDAVYIGPNTWNISNTQVAKLTMYSSDTWVLSA